MLNLANEISYVLKLFQILFVQQGSWQKAQVIIRIAESSLIQLCNS
jgi:hypothetical protein